jgi:ArsR family transcriptional regulator
MSAVGCVEFCRTLADETRQRILRLLLGREELSVSQIVEEFQLSQPTISHHLGVLKGFGLVTSRKDGKRVLYAVDRGRVAECCGNLVSALEVTEGRD